MGSRLCVRCRGSTAPDVLESAAGEAEPLALNLQGMPILACEKGHRQFVHPEFPRLLLEHLIGEDESRLPAGRKQGLLLKHYHCGGCGERLQAQPDHRETFPFEVTLPELAPFRVELTAPVYRCPACSREQLHCLDDVRQRTPVALSHAFQAAGIPPA
jgi:hypothetical protein